MPAVARCWHVEATLTQEAQNKWRHERSVALRGARHLAYRSDMSRWLCAVRLALHPVPPFIQHFPRWLRLELHPASPFFQHFLDDGYGGFAARPADRVPNAS